MFEEGGRATLLSTTSTGMSNGVDEVGNAVHRTGVIVFVIYIYLKGI